MNGEVRALSTTQNAVCWSGDKEAYSTTRATLTAGIKEGKAETSAESDLKETSTPTKPKIYGKSSITSKAIKAGAAHHV